ncbi:MAG: hypothetical protein JW776_05720 [Candidatus Lokiarchaeota archaeon]|nr:hypothetical protein [Candidatus Lokiarchaeota archaeon]
MKKYNISILFSLIILIGVVFLVPTNHSVVLITKQPLSSSFLDGDVEYLIITTEEYEAKLEPLALWKSQKGLNARIVTVEDILLNPIYLGEYDTAAKIKACINDYYTNNGTQFVLLAGDHQDVPTRLAYVDEGYYSYGDGDYVGCDSYYVNMNDWDSDGDHIYGEDDDNWNVTADVYVGRLSASNVNEMQMLANRIIMYESNPPVGDWMKKALFGGAMTYFDGDYYAPGDGVLDYPEADANRFFNYVSSQFYNDWIVTHLAEDQGIAAGVSDYPHNASLTAGSLEEGIMNGTSILGIFGHGNAKGIYRTIWDSDYDGDELFDWYGEMESRYDHSYSVAMIYTDTADYSMDANMFSISYLMGCSNGNFTTPNVDSLAEYMLKTVSIGSIGGDRIVWGEDNWTERSYGGWYDEGLAYRFFEQLDSFDQPGKAFALAKEDYQADRIALGFPEWIPEPRWSEKTLKQFNYFGDPELHVWMDIPEILNGTLSDIDGSSALLDIFTDGSGPIESVTVTVTDDSNTVIWQGSTNSTGQVELPYELNLLENYTIVATNPGYIPYLSQSQELPTGEVPEAPILSPISPQKDRDGKISLDWNDITNANSYNIYRSQDEIPELDGLEPIGTSTASNYKDSGLSNGIYFYVVTAVNENGESFASNNAMVLVELFTIPGYPLPVVISVGVISLIAIASTILKKQGLKK